MRQLGSAGTPSLSCVRLYVGLVRYRASPESGLLVCALASVSGILPERKLETSNASAVLISERTLGTR